MLQEGAIAALFGKVLSGIPDVYKPGNLTVVTLVNDGRGGNTRTTVVHSVMVQIDACTEAMKREPGYTAEDVRLLILTKGVPVDQITTDDEITTSDGRRWTCYGVTTDPARSYWECRGQRKR